ncbi:TBC1 domain family member 22A-like [Mirounga leonina]|uniref:TBC1 domain family member 22A-like n=1 Tax=Mirounga leonina TaxID=9715 RepID=UPI00156C2146|nr:TBC1 domain family member 22A-like [Mirounga leonina]
MPSRPCLASGAPGRRRDFRARGGRRRGRGRRRGPEAVLEAQQRRSPGQVNLKVRASLESSVLVFACLVLLITPSQRGGYRIIQHVYGAQHPPFDPLLHGTLLKGAPKAPATPVKAKSISTFPEFESNTSDAWDAGEDDDGLLAVAAESLNTDVVMETAHRVLRNHSQRQERRKPQEAPGPEQEPQPSAEPPSVPSGDLRLVKSVSESHTSCPAGGRGREEMTCSAARERGWSPLCAGG